MTFHKMARYVNTIQVLDDLTEYATRYGYDALGYAILDMARDNALHFSPAQAERLWEYGGNINRD